MKKRSPIRFFLVFAAFLTSGVFLIVTLNRAVALNGNVDLFHTKILASLNRLATGTRDLHIHTLETVLAYRSQFPAEGGSGPRKNERVAVTAIFDDLRRYNRLFLKKRSLHAEIEALRKEMDRFRKSRGEFLAILRELGVSGPKNPELEKKLQKAYMFYLLAYTSTLHSIDTLRNHFVAVHRSLMEEERKSLYDNFLIATSVAGVTLVLLVLLLLEINTINRKLQDYLEEREEFQRKLADANLELARYSEKLETEVKKRTDEALEHLLTNPLTKLPNRISFMEKLKKFSHASVAIFNIDRFQSYNDLFGSRVGDKIIVDYSAYLRQTIPYIYEIYHLQGDEFAIIDTDRKSASTFLSMIKQAAKLASEFHYSDPNGDFILQISIGVAVDQRQALVKADMALKHAKTSNESLVIYSDSLIKPHRYLENVTMTRELSDAIKEERIVPYFQAIAHTETKEVAKYEVLARLVDRKERILPPGQFIPLAKKIRLYPEITKIIFKKSMDIVERYGVHLSINLSVDDINHRHTRDYILDRLAMSKYSDHITFELLESEETENYDEIYRFIEKVKSHGVKVAIDDFGSGYSNFAKILKLRVDYLKIDGSFIQKLDTDPTSREFVEIIRHLAKNYHMSTVAEFVANEAIYDTVRNIGIDYVQGYYISQPLPAETLLEELKRKKREREDEEIYKGFE